MRTERGSLDSTSIAGRAPAKTRSRLSNHRDLLPDLDGRSSQARRFRDICRQLANDSGGFDQLSETRLQLIRRFAALCVHCEALESKLANGAPVNITEHSQLSSTLVRIASRLGVDRKAREIVPSLQDYLSTQYADLVEPDEEDLLDEPPPVVKKPARSANGTFVHGEAPSHHLEPKNAPAARSPHPRPRLNGRPRP